METRNSLTMTRGEGGEGEGRIEGEGSSPGTYMDNPWTTGWGLTVAGQGRATGENWDNCNRTTVK